MNHRGHRLTGGLVVFAVLVLPCTALGATFADTDTKTFSTDAATKTFQFRQLPAALSKVRVTVELWGPYASTSTRIRHADVDLDGRRTERVCSSGCSKCGKPPDSAQFQVAASSVSDGQFDVTVENSELVGPCRTATSQIRVGIEYDINGAPTARDAEIRTREDTSESIVLQASDPEGDPLSYTITTSPDHGMLTGTAPNLEYTPNPDYNGSDRFEFEVSDGSKTSGTARVDIIVEPVDDPPVWVEPTQSTFRVTAGDTFRVRARATDPDGGEITYGETRSPPGSTLDPATGEFEWPTTTADLGLHDVTFTATAGEVTIEKSIAVEVVASSEGDGADVADSRDTSSIDAETGADSRPNPSYDVRGGACAQSPTLPSPGRHGWLLLAVAALLARRRDTGD